MTERHYELHAYVCGRGCIKPSPFEGWATFSQIFQNRPSECRYAVARLVALRNHQGKVIHGPYTVGPFVVWDLYHDDVVRHQQWKTTLLRPPPPTWTGPTADAMIMKAMALYDRDQ